ncbi:hypothetical protein BH09ACT1_BH09ACT1_09540 [soil metagenome]
MKIRNAIPVSLVIILSLAGCSAPSATGTIKVAIDAPYTAASTATPLVPQAVDTECDGGTDEFTLVSHETLEIQDEQGEFVKSTVIGRGKIVNLPDGTQSCHWDVEVTGVPGENQYRAKIGKWESDYVSGTTIAMTLG